MAESKKWTPPDSDVVVGFNPPQEDVVVEIPNRVPVAGTTMKPVQVLAMPSNGQRPIDLTGMGTDIALEGGGALVGQGIGALGGPPGVVIGGAIGGGAGNVAAQQRRIAAGEQSDFRTGEFLSSVLTSAIPGAPLAAGERAVLREGVKQAAGGYAGKNIQTLIDEGRLASPTEAALSTVLPALGGMQAQKVQSSNPVIRAAAADALAGSGAVERATFEAGKAAGFVVPPSMVNPTGTTKRLESVAGKAAMGQQASLKNQDVANRLAKEALDLPENRDISPSRLDALRDDIAEPYRQVAALSPTAAADLEALRSARYEDKVYSRHFDVSADPASEARAEAAHLRAEALEQNLEATAVAAGRPELVPELRTARRQIARTYDVEKALNTANGDVSANVLASALRRGRPLTGELKTIADFALAFPSAMRDASKIPTPGVSKVEAGMTALLGLSGFGAAGPVGALAGALPLASGPVRAGLLSRPGQAMMANIPPSRVDASPDAIAAAIRLLAQSAGSNEAAAKYFNDVLTPTPTTLSRP